MSEIDLESVEITDAQLATLLGYNSSTIRELRNEGKLTTCGTKPYRYKLGAVIRENNDRLKRAAEGRQAADNDDPDMLDPVRESALLKRSQRLLIDKKLQQLEGDMVDRDTMQAALNTVCQTARTRILALPTAISSRCHGLTTSDQAAVTEACHTILEDLVSDAERVPDMLKRRVLDDAEGLIDAATKGAKQ